jgi:hypothetical protein
VYDLLKHDVTLGKICMDDSVGWMRVTGGNPFSLALSKIFKIWAFHSWRGRLYSPRTFVHFSLSLEMWALLALGHMSIIHL